MTFGDDEIKRVYRKISTPFWGLLIFSVLVISGLVFISTKGQDRNAIKASVHLAGAAMESAKGSLKSISIETAYWDQAVDNLVDDLDTHWADENLGIYLNETHQIASAYVLGKGNKPIYSALNGLPHQDDPFARFTLGLETLIEKARSGSPNEIPTPAIGFLQTSDGICLASVTVLTTYGDRGGKEVDISTESVLILTRFVNNAFLNHLAQNYLLPGLKLTRPNATSGLATIILKSPDGTNVGQLVWDPDLPGQKILPVLLIGILGVIAVMFATMVLFGRRTKEFSVRLTEQANQLELKSELLKSTLDSVDQGIAAWDDQNRLLTWNQKCEDFWYAPKGVQVGMSKRDLLGHIGDEGGLGDGDPNDVAEDRYQEIVKDGENSWDSFKLKDGRHITLYRYPLPSGGHTTVYTDVTERHNYETRLHFAKELAEEGNQAKSKFIANVSHELRTPLNAIIGFSEMMVDKVFGNLGSEKYEDYAEAINGAGRHLLEQIDQILDLSKIEAGKLILEPTNLNVRDVTTYSANFLMPQINSKQQTLNIDIPQNLPMLYADRTALNQIIINLLSNAAKFTPENGVITISCGASDDDLFLKVQDTGIGIDKQTLKTVLEPFVQVTDAQLHSQKGSGLGLSIVKALVELHDGTLEIESEIDQGTAVTCRFPHNLRADTPGS